MENEAVFIVSDNTCSIDVISRHNLYMEGADMNWYCKKCEKIHLDDELCPHIKSDLQKHPELVTEIANFTIVAGDEMLITTQALDNVASQINKVANTNFSYEGTQQFARDIQVFKRLSDEPFSKSGHFATPENAKSYLNSIIEETKTNPRAMSAFESKLTGYSQEVDWLRMRQGTISSIYEKDYLLENNAAGIDGVTINRFNGKTISRTTIKASKNKITASSTAINDVKEAIEKGAANDQDIIFGPKGTKIAAENAGLKNPVIEKNTQKQIAESNERLIEKIKNGQAVTTPTLQQVSRKVAQGAVVGAVVSVTVSSFINYIRFKNGEITEREALNNVAEEAIKGVLIGGAMAGVAIFLPGGFIGVIAGMAIGLYFNAVCTNVLDEIFGKGAYGAIMKSSGYIYGMTENLADCYRKIMANQKLVDENITNSLNEQKLIEENFVVFEEKKGE